MSIMKNNKIIAVGDVNTNTYRPPILSCMWSDHIINDIQWLRADTFSWQSGDVYKTVYDKLVEEYSTGTEETEGSITFRRSSNNFKIATSDMESAILNKYNSDGIAWYYILDTTNKRFKLPRTKFGFEGLRTNVGDDITESLPNISGYTVFHAAEQANIIDVEGGVFYGSGGSTTQYRTTSSLGVNSGTSSYGNINFNASRSSSTYQDNAPVQERATQMYLYFYVGEYAQTAIEQTAGLNSELFNGKLDKQSPTVSNGMTIESGQLIIGNTSSSLGGIELYGGNTTFGGFIDFHYGNSTADFSSRIIEHGDSFKIYNITGKPILLNDSNGVYLKYTYENGTSGYRIWTDGYCEQWGFIASSTTWKAVTVTFTKKFKDTNYCLFRNYESISSDAAAQAVAGYTSKTVSSFTCQVDHNGISTGSAWKACGYLAAGQY